MQRFLQPSFYIDYLAPVIQRQARCLRRQSHSRVDLIRLSFEFVRDCIDHTGDAGGGALTVRASDVLIRRTGYCYAKSHLLAALLRANKIPAAMCYQRLKLDDQSYGLHGLTAVFVPGKGWLRLDARGNRPGLVTEFNPVRDALAFTANASGEQDGFKRYSEPMECVIKAYLRAPDAQAFEVDLPDLLFEKLNSNS